MPFIASLVFVIVPVVQMARAETPMTDEEIRNVLKDRIDRARKSVGIVVGIIDEKGIRIIAYGKPSLDSKQTVDGDTVFEIGSITKVFTATLLADMVQRGDVSLDDPISKYLPKSVKTPTRNGKEITLRTLSSHTSGLPRDGNVTTQLKNFDPNDPMAHYTVDRMYEFLSNYALTRDIGAQYEYSNFGTGLLGHILTLRADTDYENLVRTQICQPLRMDNTCITLSPAMKARLAIGYNVFLRPVPTWNWGRSGMEGGGALRSTANDMLNFVAANMGLKKTPLTVVMETTHHVQHDKGKQDMAVGLGWNVSRKFDSEIISHGGNTTGHSAFIAFDKKKRQGVVVLSNFYNSSINDIAFHILNDRYPLDKVETLKEHKAIKLDGKKFDPYVGEYQISRGPKTYTIMVSREEERFFLQIDESPKQELLAESETEFFIDRLAVTVTFVKDDKQQVTNLVFNNDSKTSAKKIK